MTEIERLKSMAAGLTKGLEDVREEEGDVHTSTDAAFLGVTLLEVALAIREVGERLCKRVESLELDVYEIRDKLRVHFPATRVPPEESQGD